MQGSKFKEGFYKNLYDLTSIKRIDEMMELLRNQREAILKKGNLKDGGDINTLE